MKLNVRRFVPLVFALMMTSSVFAQDTHKTRGKGESHGIASAKQTSVMGERVQCQSGFANQYPCQLVDLMSFLDIQDLAGGLSNAASAANDIWGWTDPETGDEYAIIGLNSGTSFVKISDPENPVVVGFLPTHTSSSTWRDIKVYADHAFIVSEANGHGMQVLDLTQLGSIASPPVELQESAHYDEFNDAHNIVINEASGFAYVVGANSGGTTCGGGLHMVDISTPTSPSFAGCFADPTTGRAGTGYSHDAQCVIYAGPDTEHVGKEICIGSNETDISIADVSDKQNPAKISTGTYPGASYIHQGWLSEDHRYFFQDDELDELNQAVNRTKTVVWDLVDLDDPQVLDDHFSTLGVIDHNQYVKGNLLFQSNYNAGLRILDITNPEELSEIGFFDTRPSTDATSFDGSWSNYPYFESGTIAVSSIDEGLFLLSSSLVETAVDDPSLPGSMIVTAPYPNPFSSETTLSVSYEKSVRAEAAVYDVLGRRVAVLLDEVVESDTAIPLTFRANDLPDGTYIIRVTTEDNTETRIVTLIR